MKKTFLALATTLFATAAWAQTNLALPAGTALKVKLDRALTTFSNKVGDPFSGHVSDAVTLDGKTVIPIGATGTTVHWFARHRSAMIPTGTELILELNRPLMMNSTSGQ